MSTTIKTITVFGATGSQGGAVIRELLAAGQAQPEAQPARAQPGSSESESPNLRLPVNIRAVTRNPNSAQAQELQKIQGVDVVTADANDPSSLKAAFQGADAAFLVTSFWDPTAELNPETDWIQGKKLVDAALASGTVKSIVWSSLHDVDSAAAAAAAAGSPSPLKVGHYTNKNRVEQYIRQQLQQLQQHASIQAAFVYPGFYMQNWVMFPPFGVPTRKKEDGKIVLETAVRADVALPLIDIERDFGKFVVPLFADPAKFNGAKILAATEYLTVPQMAHIFEQVSGEHVELRRISEDEVPVAELKATIQLFNRFGYYLGELLEPTLEIFSGNSKGGSRFGTFKEWLQRVDFKAHASV